MDIVAIAGSSGHARVVIDIVEREGRYCIVGLLDPRVSDPMVSLGNHRFGRPVLGSEDDLPSLIRTHGISAVIVAIGDNGLRSRVVERIAAVAPGLPPARAVHPAATAGSDVSIGAGTVVMAGAVINPGCRIGQGCVVNTGARLDHDSAMGDFSSLAPCAVTGGNCRIGDFAVIGIGAVLNHGVAVGEHSVVGTVSAGAAQYGVFLRGLWRSGASHSRWGRGRPSLMSVGTVQRICPGMDRRTCALAFPGGSRP